MNSRFTAAGDGVAQLGRSLDVDSATNGQVVIRDSVINEGFKFSNHFATQTAVVVFPHAVEVSVVQVTLHVVFIIHRAGVAGERTFRDRRTGSPGPPGI